jgi:hypothetical protein
MPVFSQFDHQAIQHSQADYEGGYEVWKAASDDAAIKLMTKLWSQIIFVN